MSRITWVLVGACLVLTFCAATVKADLYWGPCLDETACCGTIYAECITGQRKRATILEYGIVLPIVLQLQQSAGVPTDGCEEGDVLVVCADKGDPGTDLLFQTGSPFPDDCGVGSQCIGSCNPNLGGVAVCDCNQLSDACCGFDCVTPSADFCTPAVCQLPGPTCVTGPARGDGIACPGPSFACSASLCQGGTCVEEALPFGARCLDGYTDSVSTTLCDLAYCDGVTLGGGGCIVEDKCQLDVGFDEQCSVAVCNAQTGDCSVQHLAAGTQCSDGNLCTVGDQCNGQGVCLGGEGSPCVEDTNVCTDPVVCIPLADGINYQCAYPQNAASCSTCQIPLLWDQQCGECRCGGGTCNTVVSSDPCTVQCGIGSCALVSNLAQCVVDTPAPDGTSCSLLCLGGLVSACQSGVCTCVSPSASPSSSRTPSTSPLPSASSTKSASRTPSRTPSTSPVPIDCLDVCTTNEFSLNNGGATRAGYPCSGETGSIDECYWSLRAEVTDCEDFSKSVVNTAIATDIRVTSQATGNSASMRATFPSAWNNPAFQCVGSELIFSSNPSSSDSFRIFWQGVNCAAFGTTRFQDLISGTVARARWLADSGVVTQSIVTSFGNSIQSRLRDCDAVCGNGVVELGEQCDVPNNGCCRGCVIRASGASCTDPNNGDCAGVCGAQLSDGCICPSQSASPSTTSVPSASPSPSSSSSSTASASATASRAPSASPSATPSRSQSASSTPSASEEPECFVGCSLSKGGVRNAKGLSPVWELSDVANFTVCNHTMMHWMDAKIAGKNADVPAGVDANDYKTWLKWLQQAWTVAFSLRRFGCSEPRPELVAIQFQTAWEWLSDPANCYVPSPNATSDEVIFDDWSNGEYATGSYDEFSGPVSCDDCECACWPYDELASGDHNCSCVECLAQTDLSLAAASSHAKRSLPLVSVLSAGQDYRVTCCLPSLQELLRDANAATKLCDGTTLADAIGGTDGAKRALALARLNADACIMAPVYAQNAYLRLLDETERKCDGDAVSDEDLAVFVETLELYSNGSYGLLGGPCACADAECLAAQSAYVSRPASSINEIVAPSSSSSKPSTRSSHTGKLSTGAILGIVFGGLLAVLLVVVLVAGLFVWLGSRKSAGAGDAESDRTHLFDGANGASDDDRGY